MINIRNEKELSGTDDITFAMLVLAELSNKYHMKPAYSQKLKSAYQTLDTIRGGKPISLTCDDMLSILRQDARQTSSEDSLQEPDEKVLFRVEYETTPIRHLAVRCPYCKAWLNAYQATRDHIPDMIVAEFARYECTGCGHKFCPAEYEVEVEECDSNEQVYRDCVK